MPVTTPTLEQDLKLRQLQDLLPSADKEDIITLLMALQRQNFALSNTIKQMLKEWPSPQTIMPVDQLNLGLHPRDQELNYHLGNAIKYISRAGQKDDYCTRLKKAIHYLQNESAMSLLSNQAIEFPPSVQYTERFEWNLQKIFDR